MTRRGLFGFLGLGSLFGAGAAKADKPQPVVVRAREAGNGWKPNTLRLRLHGCEDIVASTTAFCLAEGWFEMFLVGPKRGNGSKVMVDRKNKKIATVRVYESFDVLDREGNVLAEVRWSWFKGKGHAVRTAPGAGKIWA